MKNEEVQIGFSDILAMTIALLQIILPYAIGFMVIIGIFMYLF